MAVWWTPQDLPGGLGRVSVTEVCEQEAAVKAKRSPHQEEEQSKDTRSSEQGLSFNGHWLSSLHSILFCPCRVELLAPDRFLALDIRNYSDAQSIQSVNHEGTSEQNNAFPISRGKYDIRAE